MTRAELSALKTAIAALDAGNAFLCKAHLRRLQIDAEAEHAAEDRHADEVCTNLEEAA